VDAKRNRILGASADETVRKPKGTERRFLENQSKEHSKEL